jgi:type VI secretion system secreted protein VgrG
LGRVRIRFPWDRSPLGLDKSGATDGADKAQYLFGEQTVWVRVSDAWAGGYGFGSQFLPRVGDEVVVSFVDGDPDRPVITGRLYNPGRKGQSNLPFPVPGPAKADGSAVTDMKDLTSIAVTENQFTRSGIKTRSTPPTGPDAPNGFHMLRFDDKAGKEQLLLRSQNRLDVTALGTRYESIGGDRNLTVGWIDTKHQAVGGNYMAKVYQDYHLHVGDPAGPFNGGHRFEEVEKDYHLHVKAETNYSLDGDWNVSVGGKASITADSIVLKATKSVTVIVGNSIIVVQADGIYNEAAIHYEQSGADGQAANDAVLKPPKDPHPADSGKDPQASAGTG